jgi:hypothetical protein
LINRNKSKSNTVQLRIWLQTTWQNLSLMSSSNIFANSLWTYLTQQSLPKIGQQECVGQYMLSRILSRTRIITIIIDQKRKFSFLTPWQKDQKQSQGP